MDHPLDLRSADPEAPSGGEHLHPTPTRRDRSVLITAVLVTAAHHGRDGRRSSRAREEDAAPRQLRPDAPRDDAPAAVAATDDVGVDGDDAAVSELARRVGPSAPAAERADASSTTVARGRPAARVVFESFDGLAASVGAHAGRRRSRSSTWTTTSSRCTADIPMQSDLGPSARLRDLLFHRAGDGWRMTYESLCGSRQPRPADGRHERLSRQQRAAPRRRRAGPDALLVEDAPGSSVARPIDLAYGYSSSARTGRWAWLVDYPEQELGGGAPSSPAGAGARRRHHGRGDGSCAAGRDRTQPGR